MNNLTILRVLAVFVLLIAAVNLSPAVIAVVTGPDEVTQLEPAQTDSDAPEEEVVEDVGGPTQITGIIVYLLAFVMGLVALAMLMRYAYFSVWALILVSVDVVLKAINLTSQFITGATAQDVTLNITFIAVEIALIGALEWFRRRVDAEEAEEPGEARYFGKFFKRLGSTA